MNKYKLIAIDMDGTLLTDDKKILTETKSDILKAYQKGAIICISTGRGYPAAKRYIDELNINIPLILYNGSRVRMSKDSALLYNKVIEASVAKDVYSIINKHNGTCCFWRDDRLYFNKDNEYTTYYRNLTGVEPIILDEAIDDVFVDINKFIWFDTVERLDFAQKEILVNVSGINYFKSNTNLLEIVPTEISKGNTLSILIKQLNVSQEEVIAVGDDENDISMIKFAGLGVAMENARESVKNIADFITSTNEENGVGKVINMFML